MLRANDGSVRTARQLRRILANACVRVIQGAAAEIGSKASRQGRQGEEAILLVEVISGRAIHSSDEAKIINCNKNLVDKATQVYRERESDKGEYVSGTDSLRF